MAGLGKRKNNDKKKKVLKNVPRPAIMLADAQMKNSDMHYFAAH